MEMKDLVGKTILVGITDEDLSGNPIGQTQYFGRVTEVFANGIRVQRQDGSEFLLPPDLASTRPAPPGTYRLRSTGEIVENPDFLSVWIRTRD